MLPLQFDMFGAGIALYWIIILVWCVIGIILAIWVYRDAQSRGMNGALWLIITIFLGLIGLIIYLVVRE